MPDFSSYLDYWPNPTFTALGLEQGYIIANHIVTAADVLKIFSCLLTHEPKLAERIDVRALASQAQRLFRLRAADAAKGATLVTKQRILHLTAGGGLSWSERIYRALSLCRMA